MEYLGSLGRLMGLQCASQERVQAAPRYVEEFTLEGRRRAQVRPFSPRGWDLVVGLARPAAVATLLEFVTGAWGNGPWEWVPMQAQRGNLLTPRESVLLDRASATGVADAGPVRAADGSWAARSVTVNLASGWTALVRGLPVLPGAPFTWSVDVEGTSPGVQVAFYDAAGGQVSVVTASGSGIGMQRVSVTAPVPVGAVSAWAGVRSTATRAARPQATWTDGPVPWSAGHGCRSAIVDGLSEDLLVANSFGTYSQFSFQVLEVS